MSSSRIDSFDVSAKQREILEFRHARRNQLRQQYLKEVLNPARQTMVMDTAYERYAALRLKREYIGKLKAGYHLWFTAGYVAIYALMVWDVKSGKDEQRGRYDRGEMQVLERDFVYQ
ncbi:NADH dehydrogenase (ubiquinone) B15 subunit [Xylocopa sonorina]|uniref:NADH dehydrogenase (ubiquinone) B15 subunit n=1 Tax=Xylocopa sonorina TaxID=1818115 RepID=UPI00403AD06A